MRLPDLLPSISTDSWTFIDVVLWGAVIFAGLFVLSFLIRPRPALKNWHHHFDDLQLASADVFKQILEEVAERQIAGVKYDYTKRFQSGIFSARRQYLVIVYDKFTMDVSCMPFGTGYYMSWWLREEPPHFFSTVPILNDLLGINPKFKTIYQLDSATLFQSGIHDAILAVIDKISKEKGVRPLTELERQPRIGRL